MNRSSNQSAREMLADKDRWPRPISEVVKAKYRMIEPGVRPLVRALFGAGLTPVWSCEGHATTSRSPTWLDSPVLRRLEQAGVEWYRRPVVIVAGTLRKQHYNTKPLDKFGFVVCKIRIVRPGCSITRALPGLPPLAQAGNLAWSLVVQLAPGELARVVSSGSIQGRTPVLVHRSRAEIAPVEGRLLTDAEMQLRQRVGDFIREHGDEKVLTADGFDEAFIGLVDRCGSEPVACYDVEKCLDVLVRRDKMTREDASEFFEFNVRGAFVGSRTPMFLTSFGTGGSR